ncbi:MAG: hypothetical protein Q7S37_00595 [bacterium]|nr:hypothetical protein [bacterium]
MQESSRFQFFSQKFFSILMLAFCIYFIYLIGNLIWKNYHVDQKINQMEKEDLILRLENQSVNDYLEYYKSKTYQELELRRRLLLKAPGETVVLLPIRQNSDRSMNISQQKSLIESNKQKNILPNYYKWWLLITKGRTSID